MKKISFSLMAMFIAMMAMCFTSCKKDDDGDNSEKLMAAINADINGTLYSERAGAKVTSTKEDGTEGKIGQILGEGGTVIVASGKGGTLTIAYAGKEAGSYNCGINQEVAGNALFNFLFGNEGLGEALKDTAEDALKAYISFTDANKVTWYSTSCNVTIAGQMNGKLSLINGSFTAKMINKDKQTMTISGSIANVPGI